jgi:hypothetical protein
MFLAVRSHMQEPGPLRRQQPLVAVAGVEVGPERVEFERDLTRRVRTVDEGEDVLFACTAHELGHGQDQRGRRRDMD